MISIDKCKAKSKCILSVVGHHAGQCPNEIFARKIADIKCAGKTFWVQISRKAKPLDVRKLCRNGRTYVFFISPASKKGAKPTVERDTAKEYSVDKDEKNGWRPFPRGLSPVTGNLKSNTAALVLDELRTLDAEGDADGCLDLWNYADSFSNPRQPVGLGRGCSTICAVREDTTSHPDDRLESRHRRILAIGRIASPYCVYIR
jgi:hypothetical protein